MNTDQAKRVASTYPHIKAEEVGDVKNFKYEAGDGLAIDSILTLPPAREAKSLPLIVMPHGVVGHDKPGFDWWAQAFASRGYAVFQPNYRGSDGYGIEFEHAGYGQWGKKILSDISEGVAALAQKQIIDSKRVCIVGARFGGYAALAGVTLQQGLYRCAVSVAGYSDLVSFGDWARLMYTGGDYQPYSAYWLRSTGADVEGISFLRTISPALVAAKADAPILLIHGKGDTGIPIEQSEEMASALKRAGKPYELVSLDKEDHFLSRESTRTAMLEAAVAFVVKYNPPQ
jgi:dipeptidyl aminopeptidase/acylaminoacyl peptidase